MGLGGAGPSLLSCVPFLAQVKSSYSKTHINYGTCMQRIEMEARRWCRHWSSAFLWCERSRSKNIILSFMWLWKRSGWFPVRTQQAFHLWLWRWVLILNQGLCDSAEVGWGGKETSSFWSLETTSLVFTLLVVRWESFRLNFQKCEVCVRCLSL